jgi:hypothetical protein
MKLRWHQKTGTGSKIQALLQTSHIDIALDSSEQPEQYPPEQACW